MRFLFHQIVYSHIGEDFVYVPYHHKGPQQFVLSLAFEFVVRSVHNENVSRKTLRSHQFYIALYLFALYMEKYISNIMCIIFQALNSYFELCSDTN